MAKATSDSAAQWAFGQWSLRKRALLKFEKAGEMLFDREGLEMASHETISMYHASLFPKGATVIDMTCGIGSDSMALARRGDVFAVDLNKDRLELAAHNASVNGVRDQITFREGDGLEELVNSEVLFAFADPARRVNGKRTLNQDEFSPSPRSLKDSFSSLELGVIKLSPLLPDSELEELGQRLEFISYGRECREVLAISGSSVEPGRFVVHLESGNTYPAGSDPLPAREMGEAFYEADPAFIRSHALGPYAYDRKLKQVGEHPGYLTGPSGLSMEMLLEFELLDHGRYDLKRVKQAIAQHNLGPIELKQRGAGLDLQKLVKQLQAKGDSFGYVAFWKEGNSIRFAVLKPRK